MLNLWREQIFIWILYVDTAHSVHKYGICVSIAVRGDCGIKRGHMRRSHLLSQRWKIFGFALTPYWQTRAAWTHSYALSFTLVKKSEQENLHTES